jgi:hypothetical protein
MRWRSKDDTHITEDYLSIKPVYFNAGCCCFADGDITGIEIADGCIRLIKWEEKDQAINRFVLQERKLEELIADLTQIRNAGPQPAPSNNNSRHPF